MLIALVKTSVLSPEGRASALAGVFFLLPADLSARRPQINEGQDCAESSFRQLAMRREMAALVAKWKLYLAAVSSCRLSMNGFRKAIYLSESAGSEGAAEAEDAKRRLALDRAHAAVAFDAAAKAA